MGWVNRGRVRHAWVVSLVAGCGAAHGGGDAVTTWADLEAAARAPVEPARTVPEGQRWRLTGGDVWTATGDRFQHGEVHLVDGRIAYVGTVEDAPACDGCRSRDVQGMVLTPGLIDTHSHLGVYPSPHARAHGDGNEATAPTTPGVWAESSVWPFDPGFARAIAGGVTTLQILPGSANLVGGRGIIVRPLPARGGRAMRFEGAPETVKMACGENPKRVYGERGGPSTRMGNVKGYRAIFAKARAYKEAWDRGETPTRDVDLDTLKGILDGDFLPQVHCYRSDDMLSFMQVADEFGFSVRSFHHAIEAYKIRDVLAAHEVSVSTWSDWWGFKMEAYDAVLANAALVAEAGGRAIIHSDSAIGIQRLNQEAAKAWHDGVESGIDIDAHEALRWVTQNPAWALGLEDEIGSLEVGKRADLVVWDGDPMSVYASARWVFVEGMLAFDRTAPPTWSDFEIGQEVVP